MNECTWASIASEVGREGHISHTHTLYNNKESEGSLTLAFKLAKGLDHMDRGNLITKSNEGRDRGELGQSIETR